MAAKLRAETGRSIDVLPADLADPAASPVCRSGSRSDADRHDAGQQRRHLARAAACSKTGPTALRRLIAVNITAPTLLAHTAGNAFVGTPGRHDRQHRLGPGRRPELFDGVYSGTKAYLLNLSLEPGRGLEDTGVHVQAVLPGATRTEIWQRSGKDIDAAHARHGHGRRPTWWTPPCSASTAARP